VQYQNITNSSFAAQIKFSNPLKVSRKQKEPDVLKFTVNNSYVFIAAQDENSYLHNGFSVNKPIPKQFASRFDFRTAVLISNTASNAFAVSFILVIIF
jgi:uncharacterized Zn-finger protein